MFRYCFSFLYYFHSIVGLIPFGMDDRRRVRRSKCKQRWSLTIGGATTILVCCSFGSILLGALASSSRYMDFILIRSLVIVEFFIRYSTVVLCFYQILSNEANLHQYVHRFISIVQSVGCNRSDSMVVVPRMVYILVAKMLIVDIGLCTLFAINYGTRKHSDTYINGYRLVNIYVVMLGAQMTNLILLLLLFGSHTYARINSQLDRTVRRILCFETDGYYWSRRKVLQQQICCDASDTIDRLCSLHQELTDIIQTLFSIFQITVLLINLNQFIVIISRIYFVYITRAQTESDFISYHRLSNSILYTCFEAIQCFLLALGSSVITKEARRAGNILNLFINAPLDIRAERSIETFGVAILGTDFRIKVAGLYVLDLVFLFSLASTISTYLIVLIQFQLSTY
uniref:Gustatory receptor n=1 Tax=Anopheles funestus TaxID=62324 RepID=A0A182RD94_ANOFN